MENAFHFICIILVFSIRGEFMTHSYRRISTFDNMLGAGPYLWIKALGTSLGCGLSCSSDKTCFSFFYHAKRKECRGSALPHQHLDGEAILENGWVYFTKDSEDLSSITMTFSTTVTLPIDSLEPATSTTKGTTQPLDPFRCTTPPASKPTACPASYIYNDSLCYRVESSSIRSWHEAKCYCEEGGGHLIKIDNQQVLHYILKILKSGYSCNGYYVGGNDLDVMGTWRWLDNTLVSASVLDWKPHKPDNDPNHRCIILQSGKHYKLSTATCDLQYCYICQIDLTT